MLAEKVASEAATAAAAEAVAAAEKLIAIEATKRRAIVEHIQARREAEREAAAELIALEASKRLAVVAHLQARREAELAAATEAIAIEAAKRRAVVLHIQARREAERAATEQVVIDARAAAGEWISIWQRAFEGGGGLFGAFQATIQKGLSGITSSVQGKLSGALGSNLGGMIGGLFSGGMTTAITLGLKGVAAIGKKIWGWIAGGPSEAELAAREAFAGFHKGAVEALGGTQRFADEVQVAINAGWGTTLAETRAGFILWGTDAGLTYDQAFAKYEQYQGAVAAGNTELMAQLEEEFAGYRQTAEETNAAAARSAEEAAAKAAAAWVKTMSATMGAYFRAKDAGVAAYDKVFEAAIASGAGQEEAANQAANAQQEASDRILSEEREKYIQLAKFEAILAEIRKGNVEGAVAAGEKAATDTALAWDLSLGHIADADEIATGDRITNATSVADNAIEESDRSTDAIVGDIESIPTTRTVEIEYYGSRTGEHGPPDEDSYGDETYGDDHLEGRQHGGPVRAGRPYMVGERGPELFVPSRSGRIDPNVSSGGGGVDAKEIAKAVADALHGTKMDMDGRQFGRLVVRHQQLAIAELGGRR